LLIKSLDRYNPAAEQRGISKCIERPKGRGITPGEIKNILNVQ